METKYSIYEYNKRFDNHADALQYLMDLKISKTPILQNRKGYRMGKSQIYQDYKGDKVAPMAGTIFEGTTTSLELGFYAIDIFLKTNNNFKATELQKDLGVTYKTAGRIRSQIKSLMQEEFGEDNGVFQEEKHDYNDIRESLLEKKSRS